MGGEGRGGEWERRGGEGRGGEGKGRKVAKVRYKGDTWREMRVHARVCVCVCACAVQCECMCVGENVCCAGECVHSLSIGLPPPSPVWYSRHTAGRFNLCVTRLRSFSESLNMAARRWTSSHAFANTICSWAGAQTENVKGTLNHKMPFNPLPTTLTF